MPSPKKPKTAGKKPARSNAEWWNPARVEAFEALRRNEKPAVPERTLRGWQKSPLWQGRLAERDAAFAAAAQKTELEPLERLRAYLDGAVDTVGEMATGKLANPCKTRLTAALAILDRFRVQERDSGGSAWADAMLRLVNPEQVLESARTWGNWRQN